jgi:hypothetical protein
MRFDRSSKAEVNGLNFCLRKTVCTFYRRLFDSKTDANFADAIGVWASSSFRADPDHPFLRCRCHSSADHAQPPVQELCYIAVDVFRGLYGGR